MRQRHTVRAVALCLAAIAALAADARAQSILTNSDGVIRNSLCVGFDCPSSGVGFSDTTVMLRENNTRIKFFDTSVAAGFPSNEWELQANQSASGGRNRFALNDCGNSNSSGCAEDALFVVEAGAPQFSLYVDDAGRVGFGTSNPAVELHVVDGDTPTLRLQQDGSSGFTAQTWDVAGNETNFFIRDVTGGSSLPLRIRPGADSNALFVDSDNEVGLGTSSPAAHLDVRGDLLVEDPAVNVGVFRTSGAGAVTLQLEAQDGDDIWQFGVRANDTFVITPNGTIGAPVFVIDTAGNVTIPGGANYNGSDRRTKRDIVPVDPRAVLDDVRRLPIAHWSRKGEPGEVRHIGPMAQDFAALFGVGRDETTIATLDIAGVALAAIQGLEAELADRDARIDGLERQLLELARRLDVRDSGAAKLTTGR